MSGGIRPPAVAVCIPLYNKRRYIAETIESVLAQSFDDFEVIVADNASDDGSSEIVDAVGDPRVAVVRHRRTVPPGANFNSAVAASRAPLVKVLCADDLLLPGCLERQVATLESDRELVMVASRQHFVDGDGRVVMPDRGLRGRALLGWHDGTELVRHLARRGGNPVGSPAAVMFRRHAFDAVGGFGDAFDVSEIDLYARLVEHGAFFGLDETHAGFRFPDGVYGLVLGRSWLRSHHQLAGRLRRSPVGQVRASDAAEGVARTYAQFLRHNTLAAAERVLPRRLRQKVSDRCASRS